MSNALGLVEFKTIPVALEATDEMLKAAEVDLLLATPICPGKYITIVYGDVDAVSTSVKRGVHIGGVYIIESYIIPNASEKIKPALCGVTQVQRVESLGVIESIAAIGAIKVGDIVSKASQVELIEIRLARGLGGKGEVIFTGELGSVEAASRSALEKLGKEGGIVSSVVIARPHIKLIEMLL